MRRRVVGLIAVAAFGAVLVGCVPPVVLVPPNIYGSAAVGAELSVNSGSWFLSGSIAYEWQLCEADLTGCTPKGSAGTYTVAGSDVGHRVRVKVTNVNDFGTQVAYTAPTAVVIGPTTERVSLTSAELQGDGDSSLASGVSADGRYVLFNSGAPNIAGADLTIRPVLRDRTAGTTTLVVPGLHSGSASSMTPDARFVTFDTAESLVPADVNEVNDVYVRDRSLGTTRLVSKASDGTPAEPPEFGGTALGSLSADGRFVAFNSSASNLVPSDTNGVYDVFVHDLATGVTDRTSVASGGAQVDDCSVGSGIPQLSGDGRYVVFQSDCAGLAGPESAGADTFVHDRSLGTTELVSGSTVGSVHGSDGWHDISGDGRSVLFISSQQLVLSDTNGTWDVYLRDRVLETTTLVSVSPSGEVADASSSGFISLSHDGRYALFVSVASNLVDADTNGVIDVFVRDVQAGETVRVSVTSSGAQATGPSSGGVISATGRYAAFHSDATDLVADDSNFFTDVFVRDRAF